MTNSANRLQSQRVQQVPRGLILAGDGETELARSEQKESGTYERVYPEGPVYSGVTGYWSQRYGASGIELGQNDNLSGEGEPETLDELVNQFRGDERSGNDVELTLDPELQRLAHDHIANSVTGRGAVVAVNPKNGEILALVSYPSYDPNDIDEDFDELVRDPGSPLLNRATQGAYPPGSIFKVITAGAALKVGVRTTDMFEDTGIYETPGYDVYNHRLRVWGDQTFSGALTHSINTIFAQVAHENVGPEILAQTAYDFGFGDAYEGFPIPVRPSDLGLPPEQWVQGSTAQISFGQGPVTSNAFEMALATAAVANGGTMMEPRLVREVRTPDGVVIDKPTPSVRHRALNEDTAQTLNDMMVRVVEDYESSAVIPGVKVGGKTGTAEATVDGREEIHSWFVSFAPADDPKIAVAVLVEDGQEGHKAALPIARRLMETHLNNSGSLPNPQSAAPSSQNGYDSGHALVLDAPSER